MLGLLRLALLFKLPILCYSFFRTVSSARSAPPPTVAMSSAPSSSWFIPKEETDVLKLRDMEDFKDADGRGITIAIMDTGCDLAARGMEQTSTGLPKYVDFLDCTGDGDIDMTTIQKTSNLTEENPAACSVKGVSGKTLWLPSSLADQEVRLGAMRLYEILPKTALKRVQEERKTWFMETHNARMAKAQKDLDHLRQKQASSKGNTTEPDEKDDKPSSLAKEIKEAELLLEELQAMIKDYADGGPVMDTVLYKKDDVWQALIDLQAHGNLTSTVPMAPYGISHQFGTFQFGSHVTFCIQVYEDGGVLSLVCDAGSHGTHVAGIAAAHHPSDDPPYQRDGVAPGAQILACKIGDVRVASSETGTGLIRALIAAKRYGCQLVNLSYGEPSWQPDSGRVSQVFDDAVHKWGLTVFTSAGNDGPALSSLGSPGTLSSLITVGAYVSPQMMTDQYSTLVDGSENDDLPGASYSFSSRGPTPDGLLPDICAPGGAIAPVPRHTLQGKGQKHGTSMASPSACGVAAVVLSALKSKGIDNVNPNELRRALQNSAKKTLAESGSILDPFAQGSGLVSASRAVEYFLAHHGKPGQDLAFDIKIPASNKARGIYVRDVLQLAGPMTMSVQVKPRFEHSLAKTEEEMEAMLSLEMELDLIPSHKWVRSPDRLTLCSAKERATGQSFSIRLNPTDLSPGAHYATVDAIDPTEPERGPLFQVPITVIVPHAIVSTPPFAFASDGVVDQSTHTLGTGCDKPAVISTSDNGIDVSMEYELTPGIPVRRFLSVPASAEWASIKIRSSSPTASHSGPHSLVLHAVPFARGDLHNKMVQIKKFFQVNEGVEREFRVQLKGRSTLEVCLQLSWLANPASVSVVTDVEFHSLDARPPILVSSQPIRIDASTEFARFGASAPFRAERINPKASLSSVHRTIRPKEYKISAASDDSCRDTLPFSDAETSAAIRNEEDEADANGTLIYKAYLEYPFSLDESKDDNTISVTPRIPSLFNQIYDSPVDSQLWVMQDSNGKILGYGGPMHEAAAVTLSTKSKSDYKLTLRISHPRRKVLEELKDMPLRLAMKLGKDLDCPIYSEMDKASTPGVTEDDRQVVKIVNLRRGAHKDLYVTRPTAKLPDWVQAGDVMSGKVQLNQNADGTTSLDLTYLVPPKSSVSDGSKSKENGNGSDKKEKDDDKDSKKDEEDLADAIFQAKITHLAKLRGKNKGDAYTELAKQLKEEKADNLSLLEELLSYSKERKAPEGEADELKWRATEVSNAVEAMNVSNGGPIDEAEIAQYYGCNIPAVEDDEDEAFKEKAEKTKKEMGERRKAWRSALLAKAGAWSDVVSNEKDGKEPTEKDVGYFDEAVKELKKWVGGTGDLNSDKEKVWHTIVLANHLRICQRKTTAALASLRKARKDLPAQFYKDISEEMVKTMKSIDGMEYWLEQMDEDLAERYPKAKQLL